MELSRQGIEVGEVLSSSGVIREEGRKTVKEVVKDYWGNVVVLLDWIMEDKLVEYEVLRVVYEMVDELNVEVGMQEAYAKLGICSSFWAMYEEGKVAVGYVEKDGVEAQLFVDCEREVMLITVIGEWNGYKWKVAIETGKWVETNFNFNVKL